MYNNDKKLILKFNSKLFEINLRNTETAKLIAKSIPIKSRIQIWGEEIFFNTNLHVKLEDDAREVMQLGELAFWTEGSAIAIGYGKTPVSKENEIRLIYGGGSLGLMGELSRSVHKNKGEVLGVIPKNLLKIEL